MFRGWSADGWPWYQSIIYRTFTSITIPSDPPITFYRNIPRSTLTTSSCCSSFFPFWSAMQHRFGQWEEDTPRLRICGRVGRPHHLKAQVNQILSDDRLPHCKIWSSRRVPVFSFLKSLQWKSNYLFSECVQPLHVLYPFRASSSRPDSESISLAPILLYLKERNAVWNLYRKWTRYHRRFQPGLLVTVPRTTSTLGSYDGFRAWSIDNLDVSSLLGRWCWRPIAKCTIVWVIQALPKGMSLFVNSTSLPLFTGLDQWPVQVFHPDRHPAICYERVLTLAVYENSNLTATTFVFIAPLKSHDGLQVNQVPDFACRNIKSNQPELCLSFPTMIYRRHPSRLFWPLQQNANAVLPPTAQ